MAYSVFSGFGTVFNSTTSGFGVVSGGAVLKPHLKPGHNDTEAELPTEYDTKIGRLRIPRQINPPAPTSEMISDTRNGRLDRQFRVGKIIRASDFIGDVIPSTAVLTLSYIYNYQTRPLSVHDKVKPEQKTIRNLFYISLHEDELPTYHFWTSPEDPDPVERQGVNWSREFKANLPSPRTSERLAELQRDRYLKAQAAQLQDDEDDDSDEDEGAIDDESGPEDGETEPPAWQYKNPITNVMQDAVWLGKFRASQAPGLPDPKSVTVFPRSPEDVEAFVQKFEENDQREKEIGRREKEIDQREKAIEQREKGKIGGDSGSIPTIKAKTANIKPKGAHVLLQFRKGGMYLTEFTNKALVEMTKRLVDHEEKHPPQRKDPRMYIDIRQSNTISEYQVGSSTALTRSFGISIRPCFEKPGFDFQVRSLSMAGKSFFEKSRYDPTAIKVSRVGLGYYYVYASWGDADDAAENSRSFEYALNFFFPHEDFSRHAAAVLTLEIPQYGSFDIHRSPVPALAADIQQIFATLTSSHTSRSPPEVFIHRSTEAFQQPELEDMGPLLSSPILHAGRYLPPIPLYPHGFPAERPRRMNTPSSDYEQAQRPGPIAPMAGQGSAAGPFYCPYCDEPEDEMAQYRTKEDLTDHIDGLHFPQTPQPIQPAPPAPPAPSAPSAPPARTTHTIRQPAQQECPFEGCHDMLETDEDHPRYFLNQAHLLTHSNAAVAEAVVTATETQEKELDRLLEKIEKMRQDYQRVSNIATDYKNIIGRLTQELAETQASLANITQTINDQLETRQARSQVDQQTQTTPPRARVNRETQTTPAPRVDQQTQTTSAPRVDQQTQMTPPRAPVSRETQTTPPRTHANQGTQTTPPIAAPSPTQATTATQPPPQAPEPKKLWYCDICRKSVNALNAAKKEQHAAKCKTTVADFLYLTQQEAKLERTKPKKKVKSTSTAASASASVPKKAASQPKPKPKPKQDDEDVEVFESRTRYGGKRKAEADEPAGEEGGEPSAKKVRR